MKHLLATRVVLLLLSTASLNLYAQDGLSIIEDVTIDFTDPKVQKPVPFGSPIFTQTIYAKKGARILINGQLTISPGSGAPPSKDVRKIWCDSAYFVIECSPSTITEDPDSIVMVDLNQLNFSGPVRRIDVDASQDLWQVHENYSLKPVVAMNYQMVVPRDGYYRVRFYKRYMQNNMGSLDYKLASNISSGKVVIKSVLY